MSWHAESAVWECYSSALAVSWQVTQMHFPLPKTSGNDDGTLAGHLVHRGAET